MMFSLATISSAAGMGRAWPVALSLDGLRSSLPSLTPEHREKVLALAVGESLTVPVRRDRGALFTGFELTREA